MGKSRERTRSVGWRDGGGPDRPVFLVLLVGFTLADVYWLHPDPGDPDPDTVSAPDPDDPAALLDADLHRDGLRRRWLSDPAAVERYRDELADDATAVARSARARAKTRPRRRGGYGRPGARPGGTR